MAVIGAVVGVGIIGVVIYDNYSDHSDYGDYDNYSNYSDAEVRRQKRIEAKNQEISNQKHIINVYKTNNVNGYLKNVQLKQQTGVNVSVPAVKKDGDEKIEYDIKTVFNNESKDIAEEIDRINNVIRKIDKILESGE